jgi:signal peptidase I
MSIQHQDLVTRDGYTMSSGGLADVKTGLFLDLLRENGWARLTVAGNSMIPVLRVGDTIVVEAVTDSSICPQDIVVFLRSGALCTHRVVKSSGPNVITRGDANRHLDFPISRAECLARVIAIEREGTSIRALGAQPVLSGVLRRSMLARKIFLRMTSGEGADRFSESARGTRQ